MFSPWTGPFVVKRVFDNKTVLLQYPRAGNPADDKIVNVDRLRRFEAPLLRVTSERPDAKIQQQVVARRIHNGVEQYKIRWLAPLPTPDTWIPRGRVEPELLARFYRAERYTPGTAQFSS